jgi:pimeloyl-ACP methyl ester carboxylesterase
MITDHFKRWLLFPIVVTLFLFAAPGAGWAQQVVTGKTGEGALYEFRVPDNWNRELVVWVHGITDPALPVGLVPDTPANLVFTTVRDGLLARGYAFAYSSFSENGYAVKDGVQRTHQLRGLFIARFGQPTRTFLFGRSLGTLVMLALLETFPSHYDGAVCQCGILGGGNAEFQYLADGRVLYDVFYSSGAFGSFPYILPGDAVHPVKLPFNPGDPAFMGVLGNFIAGGPLVYHYNVTTQIPFNFADASEAVSSAMSVVGFNVIYAEDALAHTHNRPPIDNTQTVYHDALYPAFDPLINATAERFDSTPDAVNYIDKYFTPTGMINVPVYTIHTTRDPLAPIWHEALFAGKVASAGRSAFLVQKPIDRWGHCSFTVQEQLDAFDALIHWVVTGVKPTP